MKDTTPTTTQQPQRINEKLLAYWASLKQGRLYPDEQDFDTNQLGDVWISCFLVQVEAADSEPTFNYAYVGKELIDAYGDDLTGHEICETLAYPANETMIVRLKEVLKEEHPVIDENSFTNASGEEVRYRSCMLPLGHKGEKGVRYIVGGVKWRAY